MFYVLHNVKGLVERLQAAFIIQTGMLSNKLALVRVSLPTVIVRVPNTLIIKELLRKWSTCFPAYLKTLYTYALLKLSPFCHSSVPFGMPSGMADVFWPLVHGFLSWEMITILSAHV